MYIKQRLFAVALILGFAGLTYYNWHQLWEEGKYSLKLAAFGPLGIVGGFFLLLFPTMIGKPNTTQEKVIVILVFVVGLAAGLVNWFLMDPGFFGM
jgi:NhaP-type Na+/H+ or K+/H+ antiporter